MDSDKKRGNLASGDAHGPLLETSEGRTACSYNTVRAHGRSLSDFGELTSGEKKLLDACRTGAMAVISASRPKRIGKLNSVRGDFIRFLALGGDERAPVHERGVCARGAWIRGEINLTGCRIPSGLTLRECYLAANLVAHDAATLGLDFTGSSLSGLEADRISVSGGLSLCGDFCSTDRISIRGATITGLLSLSGGSIAHGGDSDFVAFNGNGIFVRGSVRIDGDFKSLGKMTFDNSEIIGNIRFRDAVVSNSKGISLSFNRAIIHGDLVLGEGFVSEGQVQMYGSHIHGSMDCNGAAFYAASQKSIAFHANGAQIGGGFFWKKIAGLRGEINLNAATANSLNDDADSWLNFKDSATFALNGFSYRRIGSGSPTDAKTRIEWLSLPRPARHSDLFWPHPWEHLAKISIEMGHVEDAKLIAIGKQMAMRKARLVGQRRTIGVSPSRRLYHSTLNWISRLLHGGYGLLAGFGYRPLWTVGWVGLVFTLCSTAYYQGREYGAFGPTSPIIQTSPHLSQCGDSREVGKQPWTSCSAMPPEYTTFQPFFYSLDLILPLVDLRQDQEWSAIVTSATGETLWLGRALRWLMWFEILFGWAASLMLVTAVSKLMDKG